jgi:hypothetical protein
MRYRKSLILIALGLLALVSTFAADVTGKWKSEFDTPVGHRSYTYDLRVEGDKLMGKAISDRGETDIQEGKVSGDDVSFVEMLNFQGQSIRVEYKGKVTGDEMRLNRQVGDFGSMDIVAKRAP